MRKFYRNLRFVSVVIILMVFVFAIHSYFTLVVSSLGKRRYNKIGTYKNLWGSLLKPNAEICSKRKHMFWNRPMNNRTYLPASLSNCLHKNGNKPGVFAYFNQQNFEDIKCVPKKVEFSKTNMTRVALASFPGSGNTWYRHLLEQISGIATGSMYCSRRLRRTFIGECKKNISRTLAIKFHGPFKPYSDAQYAYGKTLLILRNPYDTIIAEFNREYAGKRKTVEKESFKGKEWHQFVVKFSASWRHHTLSWTEFPRPLYISYYEQMKSDFYGELYRIAEFLEIKVTVKDLWCAGLDSEGNYLREKPNWLRPSIVFTPELKKTVQKEFDIVQKALKNIYNKER